MCCNNNRNRCGCRHCRPMPCCCPCCGGPTTLPSFPDWGVMPDFRQEIDFPVYVSLPASMARGTANLSVGVERVDDCGCARG